MYTRPMAFTAVHNFSPPHITNNIWGRFRLIASLIFGGLFPQPASAQSDNFDSGNDSGWSRIDSIGSYTGYPYAQHSVINGRYRLTCPPSPAPALIGNARVASYRAETMMSDFVVVVDVVAWDNTLNQAFGLLARLQNNPGLGSIFGYSMSYQPVQKELEINRVTAERPVNLATVPITLLPTEDYRFVFTGQGDQLQAAIYNLDLPLSPVATITVLDSSYAAGHCGIYGLDSTNTSGTVDVTFDNYSAGPALPPELTFNASTFLFTVKWPRLSGAWHLQSSANLWEWTPVRSGGAAIGDTITFGELMQPTRFFRLAEGW